MRIPLFHVDAFTDQAFSGNPAAVCFLDFWLDDHTLRKVAAENNLPATAFLVSSAESYELRWFSVRSEIKLCGHATLAAASVVFRVLNPELREVRFSTRFRGNLTVRKTDDLLAMDLPALDAKPCTPTTNLVSALGARIVTADVLECFEGNEIYVAVLKSQNLVQNLRPDFAQLEKLHPHALVVTAEGDEVDFVSRYFAPGYGLPEDFVTGSSHCLLTPIWGKHLGKTKMQARQLSARGGELTCEWAGDRVILQGKAVVIMQGALSL